MKTGTTRSYSPALSQENCSHGTAREAGAGLGFVSTPHTIILLKLQSFLSVEREKLILVKSQVKNKTNNIE